MIQRALPVCFVLLTACARSSVVDLGSDAFDAQPEAAPALAGGPHEPTSVSLADAGATPKVPSRSAEPGPPPVEPVWCAKGFADCDGTLDDGCEIDLLGDRLHCGTCDTACTHPDCTCEQGKLSLRCPTGWADCDGDLDNGCEVDLASDLSNCGACGHACPTTGQAVSGGRCSAGTCTLVCRHSNITPHGDCDGEADNGCETPLWDNPNHCGECDVQCRLCVDTMCL